MILLYAFILLLILKSHMFIVCDICHFYFFYLLAKINSR